MIDKATIEKIKSTADIVEVVSDYVHLVRRGANFMGLCPFHNERTPSFSVNRARNFCYCFSCHKGGSPVNFIMEKEGVSYHDALIQLAKKYGIKVEEKELTDEERASITLRESMLVANEWAMNHMQKALKETEEGRNIGLQYFYSRGITEEAIKEFRLGYVSEKGNHLTEDARKTAFNLDVFKRLGLTGVSQQGREYDKFYGRVIFPILNSSGKTIAFGGRDLKGGPAKYINSPESEIYVKSNELYGIYQAKGEIVRQNKCFLVEGYMDVIGMWQSGMKNVIASSGTALTDGQIALIHRFTENVTLLYDGDTAGVKAALRGIDMLLSHKMKVKVLLLPDGKDPDEFARDHTPEQFREYVEQNETDIIRFKAQVLLKEASNDTQKLSQALLSVVSSIACIPSDVERNLYVQDASRLFHVDETTISNAVAQRRSEILEQLISERQRRAGHRNLNHYIANEKEIAEQQTPATNPADGASDENAAAKTGISGNLFVKKNPLEPLEYKLITNCIRFGFVDFCQIKDEDGNDIMMNVADFIMEELKADNLKFGNPLYEKIINLFPLMRQDYEKAAAENLAALDAAQDQERRCIYDEMGIKGLSMGEIEREEKKLEERLAKERQRSYFEYARDYAGIVLASHEDADIRRLVNEIINDKYKLSKIYLKNQVSVDRTDDYEFLVSRSLTELRDGVLNVRLQEIHKELTICGDSDSAKAATLQQEMIVILKMRQELGKSIGERIVYLRRR